MWQQYRKTLIPLQLFIFAACITVYFVTWLWPLVLGIFAIMELGALAGAASAARLKARTEQAREALPLRPPK
jgi:hypothetical protein